MDVFLESEPSANVPASLLFLFNVHYRVCALHETEHSSRIRRVTL